MSFRIKAYSFGGFTLNPAKRLLVQGGSELKLRDKDFDVLQFLIENVGHPCSHEKIIETIWDGTFVENASVDKSIANIRKVLGDDVRNPSYIKTIRSKGYLFIGDVIEVDQSPRDAGFFVDRGRSDDRNLDHVANDNSIVNSGPNSRVSILKWIFVFALIVSGLVAVVWKGGDALTKLNRAVILQDDFSESEISPEKWTIQGNSIKISNGIVSVVCLATDNCGRLVSKFVEFDPQKTLTIESRIKVYASQSLKEKTYFLGFLGLIPMIENIGDPNTRDKGLFGVYYANYDYESKYPNGDIDEFPVEGWFLYRNGASPNKKVDYRDGKVSKRIEPLWDTWFDQRIVYEPSNGSMSYFINNELKGTFEAGKLFDQIKENKIRVEIAPRGWWLYHSIELDSFEVYQ